MGEQQISSGEPEHPLPAPQNVTESSLLEKSEHPSETPIAEENTRVVVLVIKSSRIVAKVVGRAPVYIDKGREWKPNLVEIEKKYPCLSGCRTQELDVDAISRSGNGYFSDGIRTAKASQNRGGNDAS